MYTRSRALASLLAGPVFGVIFANIAFASAALASAARSTENEPTGALVIELTGMASDEGKVAWAIWSGPEHWLEDHAVREGTVPVSSGSASIVLTGLPYGQYAVSVYHDVNSNDRLDTGLFGIPKEPLGTSNDAKIRFGPPKYDDAAFVLDQPEKTMRIMVHKIF